MALEGRDINDGDILANTTQSRNERSAAQYKYVLPSGRTITSEWVPEDKQKEALRIWIETIRQEMVSDAEEERAKVRRKAQEEDALRRREISGFDDSIPTVRGVPVQESRLVSTSGAPIAALPSDVSHDPLLFAKQEYARAVADIERLADAHARAKRWQIALVALSGGAKLPKKRRRKKAAAKSTAATGENL